MIENILILDTETTGLFPDKGDSIIEIAAVLFNIKHKAILQCFSTLLPCEKNPVEKINHISPDMTQCNYPFVKPIKSEIIENVWKNPEANHSIVYDDTVKFGQILFEMSDAAQACVAHNASFDQSFIKLLPCGQILLSKKWICTKRNFTWPVSLSRFRLEDICNVMGVAYANAHRALVDCLLIAQCFQKVDDLEDRINRC